MDEKSRMDESVVQCRLPCSVITSVALVSTSVLVTTSKAPVTTSVALVTSSFLLLVANKDLHKDSHTGKTVEGLGEQTLGELAPQTKSATRQLEDLRELQSLQARDQNQLTIG